MFLILAVLMAVPATSMVYASEIVACKHNAPKVVLRSTVRLYWGNECITLYRSGKLLLTMEDNVAIEGTYSIEDEGNWIYFYVTDRYGESQRIPAKCTIKGGTITKITYNGHTYGSR